MHREADAARLVRLGWVRLGRGRLGLGLGLANPNLSPPGELEHAARLHGCADGTAGCPGQHCPVARPLQTAAPQRLEPHLSLQRDARRPSAAAAAAAARRPTVHGVCRLCSLLRRGVRGRLLLLGCRRLLERRLLRVQPRQPGSWRLGAGALAGSRRRIARHGRRDGRAASAGSAAAASARRPARRASSELSLAAALRLGPSFARRMRSSWRQPMMATASDVAVTSCAHAPPRKGASAPSTAPAAARRAAGRPRPPPSHRAAARRSSWPARPRS